MTDDITGDLDLLGDWLDAKGYTEEAGLCTRAMDEINKLRAALKPFAELGATLAPAPEDDPPWINWEISHTDLRAARAAMEK